MPAGRCARSFATRAEAGPARVAGSMIGDWAYATAFAVYAYEHGGPTAVGVVVTLRYILRALATPFTSVLGDRYPRRLVMIGSDVRPRCSWRSQRS